MIAYFMCGFAIIFFKVFEQGPNGLDIDNQTIASNDM